MTMDEGKDQVKGASRDSNAWLAQVKRSCDPGSLFRVDRNIKPGGR